MLGPPRCDWRARTASCSNHNWQFDLSARHVSHFCQLITCLVHREVNPVFEHYLCDWPEPGCGRPDGVSHHGCLRNRRVSNSMLPKFLKEAFCTPEDAPIGSDILAQNEDILVSSHFLP